MSLDLSDLNEYQETKLTQLVSKFVREVGDLNRTAEAHALSFKEIKPFLELFEELSEKIKKYRIHTQTMD